MANENTNQEIEKDPIEDMLSALKKNQKLILGIAATIIVAFGVFAAVKEYRKSVELKAQSSLFELEKKIDTTEKELAKAKDEKSSEVNFEVSFGAEVKALKELIDQTQGTKASVRAAMKLANLYSKYDKKTEALEAIKMLKLNKSDDVLNVLFQFQKANLLLETSQFDDAIGLFDSLSELKEFEFIHALSKLKKAVALEKKGDSTEAKKLYESVSNDYPEHSAGKAARQYLRIMETN